MPHPASTPTPVHADAGHLGEKGGQRQTLRKCGPDTQGNKGQHGVHSPGATVRPRAAALPEDSPGSGEEHPASRHRNQETRVPPGLRGPHGLLPGNGGTSASALMCPRQGAPHKLAWTDRGRIEHVSAKSAGSPGLRRSGTWELKPSSGHSSLRPLAQLSSEWGPFPSRRSSPRDGQTAARSRPEAAADTRPPPNPDGKSDLSFPG